MRKKPKREVQKREKPWTGREREAVLQLSSSLSLSAGREGKKKIGGGREVPYKKVGEKRGRSQSWNGIQRLWKNYPSALLPEAPKMQHKVSRGKKYWRMLYRQKRRRRRLRLRLPKKECLFNNRCKTRRREEKGKKSLSATFLAHAAAIVGRKPKAT